MLALTRAAGYASAEESITSPGGEDGVLKQIFIDIKPGSKWGLGTLVTCSRTRLFVEVVPGDGTQTSVALLRRGGAFHSTPALCAQLVGRG